MTQTLKIHGFPLSGHTHRVELFASLTNIPHENITIDLPGGAHKKEPFLTLNPFGQVPVIEDGDTVLADSTAILVYLAKKYAPDWLPEDPIQAAEVQKFLAMGAGDLKFGPAAARVIKLFGTKISMEQAQMVSGVVLTNLNTHLEGRKWVAGDRPTIADVALYSYTAHAPEGGVDLAPYDNIRTWLKHVEGLPGFVAMPASKTGLAA